MAENDKKSPNDGQWRVDIHKITQTQRSVRTLVWGVVIVLSVYFIKEGAVEIFGEPPWVKVVTAIAASLLAPTGVIAYLMRIKKKEVEGRKDQH